MAEETSVVKEKHKHLASKIDILPCKQKVLRKNVSKDKATFWNFKKKKKENEKTRM